MNKNTFFKNMFMLSLVLLVIFSTFSLLNNSSLKIFSSNSVATKTFELNEKNFNNNIISDSYKQLNIKNIEKIPIEYFVKTCRFLDDNKLIFLGVSKENSYTSNLNLIDIKSKQIEDIDIKDSSIYSFSLSPKGDKLFYTTTNSLKNRHFLNNLYDLNSKEILALDENCYFLNWMPDNNGYLGFCDSLFIKNFSEDKKITLTNKLNSVVSINSFDNPSFKISRDGTTIYTYTRGYYPTFINTIYSIDVNENKISKSTFKGDILKFDLLDSKTLLILGIKDYRPILFSYDILTGKTNIVKESTLKSQIIDFNLSDDKRRISYVVKDHSSMNILYAGQLVNHKLTSSFEVYKDYDDITIFDWSNDNNKLLINTRNFDKDKYNLLVFTLK